jgi:hypothetical protein
LLLGQRSGVKAEPIHMEAEELTRHMAFLGASGSGKTTAALCLIEQLLERGIPVVLLDRKGDLCRYADPSAWAEMGEHQAGRREALRKRLDIALFTPGNPVGRPLTIPVVPDDLDQLPTHEREQLAGYAAAAVGSMLGYKASNPYQERQVILAKAIELLGASSGSEVSLATVRKLIEDRDADLLAAVGGFDDKQYKKLVDELLRLAHQQKALLGGKAEPLEIDLLLGRGKHARPGKTRLSIVSTHFLSDAATTDFWVAQLLLALTRWLPKNPASNLQAVFLFDEADLYLPATRQPATKAPMEGLLKRARSAGIGLFLATQSPGDFDYKCRDNIRSWLVGKVKEPTALKKLKPMFADSPLDVGGKLPTLTAGEFYLLREKEIAPARTQLSLLRTEQVPEDRIVELARLGQPPKESSP